SEVLRAGAVTYISKEASSEELLQLIRSVHSGLSPLPDDIRARLHAFGSQPTLTPREVEVMNLIAHGMRNKEIAASLNIREDTVEAHLRNIFSKLQVNDRTAAMRVALQRGVIQIS